MPSNKQKNNERAAKYQLAQEKHALDHLHNELSLAAQLLVKPQAHAGPALGGQNTTIAAISDPTWRPPTSGGDHACAPAVDLQPTWAAQLGRKCGGGGDDHSTAAAAADPEDPKRALVRGPAAASHAAEDPKHALVHALQNDLARMAHGGAESLNLSANNVGKEGAIAIAEALKVNAVLLERLDGLLSA